MGRPRGEYPNDGIHAGVGAPLRMDCAAVGVIGRLVLANVGEGGIRVVSRGEGPSPPRSAPDTRGGTVPPINRTRNHHSNLGIVTTKHEKNKQRCHFFRWLRLLQHQDW